jgi:hypothetical protein
MEGKIEIFDFKEAKREPRNCILLPVEHSGEPLALLLDIVIYYFVLRIIRQAIDHPQQE